MTGIAEQVRTAVRAVAPEAAVNVVIDDLELGPVTG
jgi:hypothetical protein